MDDKLKEAVATADKQMLYVARRDGAIYGTWTNPSPEATEVLPVDHPDVVAIMTRPLEQPALATRLKSIGLDAAQAAKLAQLIEQE
jgi:hypothetical protein